MKKKFLFYLFCVILKEERLDLISWCDFIKAIFFSTGESLHVCCFHCNIIKANAIKEINMQITEERTDHVVTLVISGRIDVNASATLEEELMKWIPAQVIKAIVLDLSAVDYISSAGIRVLLSAQKKKKDDHEFIIKNPSKFCRQVFEVTGADIFLKIL